MKYFAISLENRYGFINNEGQVMIEPKFEYVCEFFEGLAAVQVGNKWGFIDKDGKYIWEPQFYKTIYL